MIADNLVTLVCILVGAFFMGVGMGMRNWFVFFINFFPFICNFIILIRRVII